MRGREYDPAFAGDMKNLSRFLDANLQKRGKSRLSLLGMRVKLLWKGFLSFFLQQKKARTPVSCDVLLIHPSEKSFIQGRKRPLINALRGRGLNVEEIIENDYLLIKRRFFLAPPCKVPLSYRWHAAHAAYLLNKYQAKVIVTERNGWIVPSFIKAFREKDAKIVHLAHSVLTSQSDSYRYHDYDYYVLFGKSSYDYLVNLDGRLGECSIVYAGPYFFLDELKISHRLGRKDGELNFLFLGSGPDFEKKSSYSEKCLWVVEWLKKNKTARLSVKVHPRGTGTPWKALSVDSTQIEILPLDTQLDQAAIQSDLVLTGYTNAVIDISRAGAPFIVLGEDSDYFSINRFEMPMVRSAEQLDSAIKGVLCNKAVYERNSRRFFSYHVENLTPLGSLVEVIQVVASGGTPEGAIFVSPKG